MYRKKYNTKKIIKTYLKNIPKQIKVKGVFLFGSYATGKINDNSDLDFIVISPSFEKMGFLKRLELLSLAQMGDVITRSVPLDIIGYTPEEFKNIDKESAIMKSAKSEGKMLVWN